METLFEEMTNFKFDSFESLSPNGRLEQYMYLVFIRDKK